MMSHADVPAVLDIQEPAAVRALSRVFPQDTYPFPREALSRRWRREIDDPETDCFVVESNGVVSGFAAIREDQFSHFGTALVHWGSGLAA